jgi:alpha-1,4-digalacturonate transport system permease protein
LPILINLVYAATGGVQLFPFQRPFTGWENFGILLECRDYFDIQTCRKDVFWRAIFNTVKFSLIQVVLMVLLSLLTALVLNRKIIGRGFWRGVFFYPVLLSPVVVALIWKWLLQSQGVFNAALVAWGSTPVDWLTDAGWAFFWTVFVSIWAHMGFYTLILAGRAAGHSQRHVRGSRNGRSLALAHLAAHHAAAADAQSDCGAGAGTDPGGADF